MDDDEVIRMREYGIYGTEADVVAYREWCASVREMVWQQVMGEVREAEARELERWQALREKWAGELDR